MILIISDSNDRSTSDIIQWLNFYKKKFIRVNGSDIVKLNQIAINSGKISINKNGAIINFNSIKSIWYRRGDFRFEEESKITSKKKSFEKIYLKNEIQIIKDYLQFTIKTKKHLNDFYTTSINKLQALQLAKNSGLLIPDTLVTSRRNDLKAFASKHQAIITKPAFESPLYLDENMKFYTSVVTKEDINNLPETFFMSLFQNCLDKKYELRIFYMDGICNSMAIFSQNDEQTNVDFRNYKGNKPNRKAPFKLPEDLSKKIDHFMKSADLNCGSIDIVVTNTNEYVFLEVNPVGQFGMVSFPCNYKIEQKIATYL